MLKLRYIETAEWKERNKRQTKYRLLGINVDSDCEVWKGDIKRQKGLPFLKKYISQWHTAYWSSAWLDILCRLSPFEKNRGKIKRGYIKADLLLEAEKWLRYQCSNNKGSCYAGHYKYIWKTEWAEEYCKENKINPTAFAVTSSGVDLTQIMNDTAEWI